MKYYNFYPIQIYANIIFLVKLLTPVLNVILERLLKLEEECVLSKFLGTFIF